MNPDRVNFCFVAFSSHVNAITATALIDIHHEIQEKVKQKKSRLQLKIRIKQRQIYPRH